MDFLSIVPHLLCLLLFPSIKIHNVFQSNRCHLNNMSPKELIVHSEHEQEWGGYFIIRGLERLVRMLIMTRRNYPIAVKRSTWKGRGEQFSDLGIFLRSVRDDGSSIVCTLIESFCMLYSCHTYYHNCMCLFTEQYSALCDRWFCKICIYI